MAEITLIGGGAFGLRIAILENGLSLATEAGRNGGPQLAVGMADEEGVGVLESEAAMDFRFFEGVCSKSPFGRRQAHVSFDRVAHGNAPISRV